MAPEYIFGCSNFQNFPGEASQDPPTGGGHPLPYPPPRAPLPHSTAPWHITESGRIQFPPATFYKNENPDCYSLIDAGLLPSVITHYIKKAFSDVTM